MLDANRMRDFLTRLINLPYAYGTTHEKRIGETLDEYGIVYTYLPKGPQQFPDYEIPTRWGKIKLECKSSKDTKPMYNSGRPHADGCLLYTSPSPRD